VATTTLSRPDSVEFRPRRWLRGGHVQTIASFLLPRRFAVSRPEERLVEVEPGIQVLCHCHWQTERRSALTVIIIHGLEGSSESNYMLGIAEKGMAAGMNVIRMNQRTCGGTDRLAIIRGDPATWLRWRSISSNATKSPSSRFVDFPWAAIWC
jgi:predicted alpha/beta-fold hydrolase